jgi:N-acetylglutamate synthase-like GNAT family acetyltransferase
VTVWRRIRESRAALTASIVIAVAGPVYLVMAFPLIWERQIAMMTLAVSPGASESVVTHALLQQMILNIFGWLVPIGLVIGAVLFLALRHFVRRDEI